MTNIKQVKKIVLNAVIVLTLAISVVMPYNAALAAETSTAKSTGLIAAIVNFLTPAPAEAEVADDRAARLDAYFAKRDMPLEGYGAKFIEVADKNGMDWRLMPAIAIRESSGGKHLLNNNPFGWGSCKINFKSDEEAIEIVAKNLGGNNPNTDQHYADKTTKEILQKYNSVIPTYAEKVMKVMDEIGENPDTITAKA